MDTAAAKATLGADPAVLVEGLFRRHGDDLLAYLRHLSGNDDDASDLRQDVFAAVLRASRRGLAEPRDERAWLFRVARNLAIDRWRRRRVLGLVLRYSETTTPMDGYDPDEALTVWAAVDRLPLHWREAIVLRYRWDMSPQEIARVQGKTEGAIRAELSRARARLQKDLMR